MDKNPVKSKEIKLLHLGGSQKEALEVIIKKFLENKK
jgi:hypothetical protein